jgi:dihydrofolate synthase / folylpolyglutamate synthase
VIPGPQNTTVIPRCSTLTATELSPGTRWLYSFDKYGWKFGLERITLLLKRLGDPQKNLRCIHVAGTNGKGSVCQYIASVLQEAGYRVGVYTSPHIQWFTERVVINNIPISPDDIDTYVGVIRPVVDQMIAEGEPPTFFEITTALAFLYFRDQNIDFGVIEVGLGGRFDATNVILPLVSVITNIALDHTDILGNTMEKIAMEKAGIIKDHVPVVTSASGEALTTIRKTAERHGSSLVVIPETRWSRTAASAKAQTFQIQGELRDFTVTTRMLGLYQGQNIAVALAALEQLQVQGVFLSDQAITEGVEKAFNPGRMEIIADEPLIILDGAHNPNGMSMLRKTIEKDFPKKRIILVLGMCHDKDIRGVLESIVPLAWKIVLTKSLNPRACAPLKLQDIAEPLARDREIIACESVPLAMSTAMHLAGEKDLILVTGSLFTVGEARSYLFEEAEVS